MAQVREPLLWVLAQLFLSAAVSGLSSFGPCVIPLVTSFLLSELAVFAPLPNDLCGGGSWGRTVGKSRRSRMIIGYSQALLITGTDSRDHKSPQIQAKSTSLSLQASQPRARKQQPFLTLPHPSPLIQTFCLYLLNTPLLLLHECCKLLQTTTLVHAASLIHVL